MTIVKEPHAQLYVTRRWGELASVTEQLTDDLYASVIIFAKLEIFVLFLLILSTIQLSSINNINKKFLAISLNLIIRRPNLYILYL